jgi:hypothetical protein
MVKPIRFRADAATVTPDLRIIARRSSAAGAALALLLPISTGSAAATSEATTARAARAQAATAATQVAEVTARLQVAQRGYARAVARVGVSVTDSVLATSASDDAARSALAAQDASAASARALYQGGGQLGLLGTLLESGSVDDLTVRILGVRQVLGATDARARDAGVTSARSAAAASRLAAGADTSVVTAEQVGRRAEEIDRLLARAQARLDALSTRARQLTRAVAAAKALARARAGAATARTAAAAGARPQVPPAQYFALYRSASRTCPGMAWTLLAAVGQVESGHGRNVGPSSAGAVGPMQFLPPTFASYAVDGDRDGRLDPYSPADSIFTAARYLCAGGAGSPSGVRAALFTYNHAQWYVDLVLGVQAQLAQPTRSAPISGPGRQRALALHRSP